MSASEKLEGIDLGNGWKVTELVQHNGNATGGNFSNSYIVEKTEVKAGRIFTQRGFLKAFDFRRAFEEGRETLTVLQALTNAYIHERSVLEHIKDRRLSHAVTAVDHGSVQVPGFTEMEGRVYYLIFQLADGDVRVQMDRSTACDTLWCVKALRDVTLGLHQVHRELIAHQDTKPSNVLAFPGPVFRIADFGRSSMKGRPAPHDELNVAGDPIYAPPELRYGQVDPDFIRRRVACDLYMLGNLAIFLFTGINLSVEIQKRISEEHQPYNWAGTYREVLPYVQTAYRTVLAEVEETIDGRVRSQIFAMICDLCEPDVSRRGHPRGLGQLNQFSLERYVSQTNRLVGQLELRMRIDSKTA